MQKSEKKYAVGCLPVLACLTAFMGIISAPFCWILKDGLLGAYPSYGMGALSHFFRCYLWGIWPTATLVLVLCSTQSRITRRICIGLLVICIAIFMISGVYTKAYIGHKSWDEPFSAYSRITLWHQGQPRTYQWPADKWSRENDKLWFDWQYAHNSTHCWRSMHGSIKSPIAECRLSSGSILWDDEHVVITTKRGFFIRPRNNEDDRLLRFFFRELSGTTPAN